MRQRYTQSPLIRVNDLSGGMLRKLETGKLPTRFLRDATNMRFSAGSPQTRDGTGRLQSIARVSRAILFPGDAVDYVEILKNTSCPLWTGMGDFSLEWAEKPVSMPASPSTNGRLIFGLGDSTRMHLAMYAGTGLDPTLPKNCRYIAFTEAGSSTLVTKVIGSVDAVAGVPSSRRYYMRVRRKGRALDGFILGAAAGAQAATWAEAFTTSSVLLKAATSSFYVGGYGIGGAEPGLNATIDEIRVWSRYHHDASRCYWSGHPMLEDDFLVLRLGFDEEGSVTTVTDDSLYGNHGSTKGSAHSARCSGIAESLAVGQMVAEFAPPGKLQRVVAAGGAIYREAVY